PLVNAGAVGLDKPFIVLNSSTIEILDQDQVEAVIGHEVGHILSGHAVYRTMMIILLQFSFTRYPLAGVAVRPILYALLEWSRKAELSCDRAGLLATQDPEVSLSTLMRMAGGSRGEELNLDEFIAQSDEYREGGDLLDGIYKFMAMLGTTHPFAVVRVAELRDWIDSGEYERILIGEYRSNADEADIRYTEDVGDAAATYAAKARDVVDGVGRGVISIAGKVGDAWRTAGAGDAVYADEDEAAEG
ncbi:MAG: M48 family metallopeptidase, partial [Acidimicrobiales bacterium]|nr:M48 family metallopeptidase [Acidimicrobiales bacterium]